MDSDEAPVTGFIGEYEHSVDGKNRVVLPSAIRDKLDTDSRLVLTIGFDGCLTLYPSYEQFESFVDRTAEKGPTENARKLRRKLVGQAREVSVDSQGRLVLPGELKDEAGISDSVTVVGNFDSVDLWDPERWRSYLQDVDLEDAAQSVFEDDA
jgi:MraZ protein